MLREFWPPVSVCALPDLWKKTASSCASHAKNSHTSFFFLQPCCRASDSSDVSAGSIIQKEIDCKRAALWVQTKGPSSTALPPAQSQGSCLSKSRNQAAPTTLPLWTVPPTLWPVCVCSGGSSARCALLSQESAVHLTLPKGLPSPTLSLLQLLAHTASRGEGLPRAHLLHRAPALALSLAMAPCLWELLEFCAWKIISFPICLCLWWFPVLTHSVVPFPNCAVLN